MWVRSQVHRDLSEFNEKKIWIPFLKLSSLELVLSSGLEFVCVCVAWFGSGYVFETTCLVFFFCKKQNNHLLRGLSFSFKC